MGVCDTCGNEYDKTFTVTMAGVGGAIGTFDSFECAVYLIAPSCAHCGCRILGHGAEVDGAIYCCAHCARVVPSDEERGGEQRLVDRA